MNIIKLSSTIKKHLSLLACLSLVLVSIITYAAITETFTASTTQAGNVGAPASRTIAVSTPPAPGNVGRIGNCNINFVDNATLNGCNTLAGFDPNCGDNNATIVVKQLGLLPTDTCTTAQIFNQLQQLAGVTDPVHGTLNRSGTTFTAQNPPPTPAQVTPIFFSSTTSDFLSTATFSGTVAQQQITQFTPSDANIADVTYRATINGTNYDFVSSTGSETAQDIVEFLQPLMNTNGAVSCTEDDVRVTCTSNANGTFSASSLADDFVDPVITSVVTTDTVTEDVSTATAIDIDATDANGPIVYSLNGGADDSEFTIGASDGVLSFAAVPSFETPTDAGGDNVYNARVRVTDDAGNFVTQDITITVLEVAEAPVITSNGGGATASININENTTTVTTVTATDDDLPAENITLSVSGGADAGLFTFTPGTGVLVFTTAPDFEIPTDANTDNDYIIEITATDDSVGLLASTQTITVTVDDIDDTPPVAVIVDMPFNNGLVTLTPTLELTCEPDATVSVASPNMVVSPVTGTCTAGGTLSLPIAITAGSLTTELTLFQTDLALNVGPNSTHTVEPDDDGDLVPNTTEDLAGTDDTDNTNFPVDTDGDGVPDDVETQEGTDPNDGTDFTDTDGDGHPDYVELVNGSDPTDPASTPTDTDGDGVPDSVEILQGTNPNDDTSFLDTDGDEVPDYVENIQGTDLSDPASFLDTDGDGVPDHVELQDVPATDINDATNFTDTDNDGVPDYVEERGFNNGDGDGDGIQDSIQQNVSGAFNPVTGEYTTLRSDGVNCTFITQNAFLAESSLTVEDPSASYPVGLVDFQVQCVNPGDSADIVLYYTQEYDTSLWGYKKYNDAGLEYSGITNLVTFGVANVGGINVTTASFTVTDGDPQTDEDGIADMFINDPSGPAIVSLPRRGGGAPTNHPVTFCNENGKCVQRYPIRNIGTTETYDEYLECKSSGINDRYQCTRDWIEANNFGTCDANKNTCFSHYSDEEKQALTPELQEFLPSAPEEKNATACETIQYKRYREKREIGVDPSWFLDVSSDDRAYNALIDLAEQGIVKGDANTNFARLNDPINRSEVVKILSRAASHDVKYGSCLENQFPDVENGSWYHRYVENMRERGIVDGYPSGEYKPGNTINLVELYKITALTLGLINKGEISSIEGQAWYEPYKDVLTDAKVIPEWFDDYEPGQVLNREDVFALISNTLLMIDNR